MNINSVGIVRQLNDDLRQRGRGGRVLITNGVGALTVPEVDAVFAAITTFDKFDENNDPYSEHDFGCVDVGDHRIMWKIDYYDRQRQHGSPNPADPSVTCRVMTVMLAEEY